MKVSQQKKRETRRTLVSTAADLFVLQGYDNTSLKQIAREAGVGDATIYKYFSNKDKLVLGFYEVRGEDAIEAYHSTDGIEEYQFGEKLQLLVDTYLEQLANDREFVELSLKLFLKSPISIFKNELSIAEAYRIEFQQLLDEADHDKTFPDIPLRQTLALLLTDFLFGITLYWMKDESEDYADTTKVVELSIALFESLLRSGITGRAMDLFGFVVKGQLSRLLTTGENILPMVKLIKTAVNEQKNGFSKWVTKSSQGNSREP